MTQLYVPIDYTTLAEILPGDDILYSNIAKSLRWDFNSRRRYKSHILITQNGLAATGSLRAKKLMHGYYPWTNDKHWKKRKSFKKKKIMCFLSRSRGYRHGVAFDSQFEDKVSFMERKMVFGMFCKDLYLKANGLL